MKSYQSPILKIIMLLDGDVITTSTPYITPGFADDNTLPTFSN